jgi:membrane protease YdiL (CAAX protease family)
MSGKKWCTILFEAIICSFGLMVFSFFINYKIPARLVSYAALVVSAFIISRNLTAFSDLKNITGTGLSKGINLIYCIIGIAGGILLATMYRWHLDISIFPKSFHSFVIVAALIGCTEELVFRGFIQEHVKSINGPFSVLFSTLSHTGYKCCLFLSPVIAANIDIGFLALCTFVAGTIFGIVRHVSKSVLPPLIAHALFDIIVYAEFVSAPWWVW